MENKPGHGFFSSKGLMLLAILILFILILSFFFGDSGFLEIRNSRREIERLQAENDKLKQERDRLAEEVRSLENDPLALEKTAREKLWLMKKNEKVIVIIEPKIDNKKNNQATAQKATDEK